MRVADRWYETLTYDGAVTRIRESHVDPALRCNMWHLAGRDRDLLIDSGLGLRPLRAEVACLRDRPVLACASHCHFDHIGGHHEFEERCVHGAEAAALRTPTVENTVWSGFQGMLKLSALPYPDFDPLRYAVEPAPPTRLIDEGDEIDLGDRLLKVFHLPGHSPGSVCLYEAATRTLYTGDVIYAGELFDWLYHSDIERYLESMARLKEIPATVYHCGHFESFGRQRLVALVDAYVASKRGAAPAPARRWPDGVPIRV